MAVLYITVHCHFQLGCDLKLPLAKQVTDLAACGFEPGSASRVMLGREGKGLIVYDLEAQKVAAKVMHTLLFMV